MKVLWLGKAVPRAWLAAGETAIMVQNATTRYGRVSFSMQASSPSGSSSAPSAAAGISGASATVATQYDVKVGVTVPAGWATKAGKPAGGLNIRVRVPLTHAGKMSGVTLGGKAWAGFDAATEAVVISSDQLTGTLLTQGLQDIVVSFGAAAAAPLRRAAVHLN